MDIACRVKKLGTRYKSPQGYNQDCILAGLTWLNWFNGVCFLWNCHIRTSFEIGFVFSQASGSTCQTKPEPIKGPIEFPAHLRMSVVFLIKPQEKQDEDTCALPRGRKTSHSLWMKDSAGPRKFGLSLANLLLLSRKLAKSCGEKWEGGCLPTATCSPVHTEIWSIALWI